MPIKLTINGKTHALTVEPRVTLLDAMRNRLDITGQKRVCDRGTLRRLHRDRRRPHASMPARCSRSRCRARTIRTVEGLTQGTVLHPVQQAFCEHDGLMCGFCTPGFVDVGGGAAREDTRRRRPSRRKAALDGNICRCGTYTRVLEAVLDDEGGGPWLRPAGPRSQDAGAARNSTRSIRGPTKPDAARHARARGSTGR